MILPQDYTKLNSTKRRKVREEYVKVQKGKCCYCGESLDKNPCSSVRNKPITKAFFPRGFFNYPIHLHHNHDTGLTIGAIHCYCNAVSWEYDGE